MFGGGPYEPRYSQNGDLFFVTSPLGDKFSIYDAATNKASTVRLPSSKEFPLQVTPSVGGDVISLSLNGPKLSRLYAFSRADWKWYPQDIKEPVTGAVSPILASSGGCYYAQGRTIYAFGAGAKRWTILDLPQDAPAPPRMGSTLDSIFVEYDGHIYKFSDKSGEWKHIDLRALIDAAIKSAEDGVR